MISIVMVVLSESEKLFSCVIVMSENVDVDDEFTLTVLLTELDDYITHRIAHTYFWELHEFHHSATEMNIFNVNRNS